ncbi:hypothetical protein [Bacillus sp. 2205SS5-2]|uniref:hypothetical protein n=1 Tax=Bacillus sp. 2205SS5-2 TaxID=3109031 RepID=UPI0030063BA4
MYYILQPFLVITYFFATLLEDTQKKKTTLVTYFKNIVFHVLYILIISIPVAGLIYLYIYIVMFNQGSIAFSLLLFFKLNIFIWGCMFPTVFLNIGNIKMNIPDFIINVYLVVIKINVLKQIKLAIGWTLFVTILYYYLFSNIILEILPHENWLLVGMLVICIFFSVMLFSEGTIDHKQRIVRKFMLWFLLFLLLFGFSISQIVFTITIGNEVEMIFVVPVVLGLIFNFSFILENARDLYKVYVMENIDFIKEKQNWMNNKESFSYDYLKKIFYMKRKELRIIKEKYLNMNDSEKKQFYKFTIIFLLLLVVFYGVYMFLFVNQIEKTETFVMHIFKGIYTFYVSLFQGNERLANTMAILCFFVYYFFLELNRALSRFKFLSTQEKIAQIEKIIIILTANVVTIFYLFNLKNLFLQYIVIIFMFISVVILPLVRKLIKKIDRINMKSDDNSFDQ